MQRARLMHKPSKLGKFFIKLRISKLGKIKIDKTLPTGDRGGRHTPIFLYKYVKIKMATGGSRMFVGTQYPAEFLDSLPSSRLQRQLLCKPYPSTCRLTLNFPNAPKVPVFLTPIFSFISLAISISLY